MKEPKTPVVLGVRTFFQALAGLLVGLVLAVWNVPGVPEVVVNYAQENFLPLFISLLVFVGLPTGLIAWLQNRLGK